MYVHICMYIYIYIHTCIHISYCIAWHGMLCCMLSCYNMLSLWSGAVACRACSAENNSEQPSEPFLIGSSRWGGFSKGWFSDNNNNKNTNIDNNATTITHTLLNPPLLNPPLWTPDWKRLYLDKVSTMYCFTTCVVSLLKRLFQALRRARCKQGCIDDNADTRALRWVSYCAGLKPGKAGATAWDSAMWFEATRVRECVYSHACAHPRVWNQCAHRHVCASVRGSVRGWAATQSVWAQSRVLTAYECSLSLCHPSKPWSRLCFVFGLSTACANAPSVSWDYREKEVCDHAVVCVYTNTGIELSCQLEGSINSPKQSHLSLWLMCLCRSGRS